MVFFIGCVWCPWSYTAKSEVRQTNHQEGQGQTQTELSDGSFQNSHISHWVNRQKLSLSKSCLGDVKITRNPPNLLDALFKSVLTKSLSGVECISASEPPYAEHMFWLEKGEHEFLVPPHWFRMPRMSNQVMRREKLIWLICVMCCVLLIYWKRASFYVVHAKALWSKISCLKQLENSMMKKKSTNKRNSALW